MRSALLLFDESKNVEAFGAFYSSYNFTFSSSTRFRLLPKPIRFDSREKGIILFCVIVAESLKVSDNSEI